MGPLSKPRRRELPRGVFWPLLPEPAVFPNFEPMPRPTRTLRFREPLGGFKLESPIATGALAFWADFRLLETFFAIALLHHFHEVAHFVDHAAHRGRVLALDHLMHSPQPEAANRLAHIIGAADEAHHPLDFHLAGILCSHLVGGGFLFPGH